MKTPGRHPAALICAIVLALAFTSRLASAAGRQPNLLIVLADQWRAQAFGFAGDPNVKTPAFDRLAGQSTRFRFAVSSLPVCSPTRASLLTGQRPLTHGVFLNDVPLGSNAVTLAKVLKMAGYETGFIGKWHLDGHGRSNYTPPERRQGFDYWKGLECTHAYSNSVYYADSPEPLKWPGYDAIAQTEDARAFIRARARSSKPFFLFLSWGPPHDPYGTAPAEYRQLYDPAKLALRPNVPAHLEAETRRLLAGYYAHCSALDDCMRRLLDTLDSERAAGNTILLFTSDHGDMLGSHGLFKKQKPFDESILVPMLFRWPNGLGGEGRTLDAPISTEDVMPTLLGLLQLKIPSQVEGRDYSGSMRTGTAPRGIAAVIQCIAPFGEWERRAGGKEYRGIRTARHTYVRDRDGPWLLFDNQADPFQTNNLAGIPAFAPLQARLENTLRRELRERRDEFLPGSIYIQRWGYTVNEHGTVRYTP